MAASCRGGQWWRACLYAPPRSSHALPACRASRAVPSAGLCPSATRPPRQAWFRRASAFFGAGEFNECAYDLEMAKQLAPADSAIVELRKKAEEERENHTYTFAADCKKLEESTQMSEGAALDGIRPERPSTASVKQAYGDLDAVRTMASIERFNGQQINIDGTRRLTLSWDDGRQTVVSPSPLDRRALFCFEVRVSGVSVDQWKWT